MIDYSGGDRTLAAVIADALAKMTVTVDLARLNVIERRIQAASRQQIDPRDQQL